MTPLFIRLAVFPPYRIFLWGGLCCVLIWLCAPIDYSYEAGPSSLFILLSYVYLFLLTLFFACGQMRARVLTFECEAGSISRLVWLIYGLGSIGLLLRVIERIFMRAGGNLSSDFMENRELIASGGSGSLALLGGVLSSFFLFLPIFICMMRVAGARRWYHFPMLFCCLLFAVFDMVIQGSRSILVVFMATSLMSALMTGYVRLSLRNLVLGVVVAIAFIWLGGMVFWIRTQQMGMDPVASMELSGYARFAPASAQVVDYLGQNDSSGLAGLVYALTHFSQYITHGLYEFFYLTSLVDGASTYGLHSFYIPAKIVMAALGKGDIEDVLSAGVIRPGVYTTLFGPVVYDFGIWGGALACVVFASVLGLVARALRYRRLAWLPMYLIFCSFLPFFLVVNLFVSGIGQYAMIAAVLLGLILRVFYSTLFKASDAV
ncbi:hypothetical protein ACIOVF_18315 [Pseudomonas sp. NPDC087612]|uniref:hypothetical protein n=1 Tax=Pseudomonas sp. NPDC087612 TaxID=3364441 RepID=UPI0037FD141F